ncbi:2-phospho-L-lactate transferase [Mesorhizobium sp. A556]
MSPAVLPAHGRVVALCGGIGGAKLAYGLSRILPPENLTVIVNTGDDFCHFGLHVSPDVDTVTYTLAERANTVTGWGREGESWRFMEAIRELGGPDWFNLGDMDLATKAYRTQRLAEGARLTDVTTEIARSLGVFCTIMPATDDPVPTVVETPDGPMPFQHYFVRHRWQPVVRALNLDAARKAQPTREALDALRQDDLAAIVICPSNPYLSIDPMLALPGIREALVASSAPVVAVAPLVGGEAIKGPLAKMMGELGLDVSLQTIADHYADFLDILVADIEDRDVPVSSPSLFHAQTVMAGAQDRIALAREVLAIAQDAKVRRP